MTQLDDFCQDRADAVDAADDARWERLIQEARGQ